MALLSFLFLASPLCPLQGQGTPPPRVMYVGGSAELTNLFKLFLQRQDFNQASLPQSLGSLILLPLKNWTPKQLAPNSYCYQKYH